MPFPVLPLPPVPRDPLRMLRRCLRHVIAALAGLLTGPILLLAGLLSLTGWRAVLRLPVRAELFRLRRGDALEVEDPEALRRPGRVLLLGLLATVLGYVMVELLILMAVLVVGGAGQLVIEEPVELRFSDWWVVSRPAVEILLVGGGASVLAVAVAGELSVWLQARVLARWTPVTRPDALDSRLGRLVITRRGAVLAIDEERRRIERDLHDGVQQNVVSLSVTLARARRAADPARRDALLGQALEQSRALIEETREVAWRVYPQALDEHGLVSALSGVAATAPLPVGLAHELTARPPQAVESAAYFVAREAITNVVKHAEADSARIVLHGEATGRRGLLRLEIHDDGRGGADPNGSGLQGLARRVAALDGTVEVLSPDGGPTVITAEIPYALDDERA